MKKYQAVMTKGILAMSLLPIVSEVQAIAMKPDDMRLPDEIKVYYSNKVGLSRTSFKGASTNVLPTNNDYKEAPGCYIACYSNNPKIAPKLGAYPVSANSYMMGQVRVKGHYQDGYCIPTGFENKNIRTSKEMTEACEKSFPAMCEHNTCYANGQTSNWFY